ncbi:hypothetical protein ACFE04_010849 [Oxalis oulophora]
METLGFLELIVALLSFFLICFVRKNRNSPVITNWPVFGMLPGMLRNAKRVHEFSTECMKKCGGTFEFHGPAKFLKMDYLVTCDPLNIAHILSRNFNNYEKGDEFREIFEPLGDGIFRSDSDLWKFHRKSIHSWVKNSKYETALVKVVWEKISEGLVPLLEHFAVQGTEFDFQDLMQRFTFDNVCLLAYGYDPNSLSIELPEFSHEKAIHVVEEAAIYRHMIPKFVWKFQRFLQIGEERKIKQACDSLDVFLYQCIRRSKEKLLKSNPEDEFDFLTFYLSSVGEEDIIDGRKLKSDKFIRDVTFNLMIAGRDTMSSCLCWFFWLVATHPAVEEKILEEINSYLSKVEGDRLFTTTQELSSFTYLHAVLCETLRLYPSVPINEYTTIKSDITPTGHLLNPETRILVPFYAMGRMKSVWGEDCLEFKPERFIQEEKGSAKNFPTYKFTAFNLGPRACVGKDISLVQMKMVAVGVLKNFKITAVEGHVVAPSNSIILHMRDGLKVKVVKREEFRWIYLRGTPRCSKPVIVSGKSSSEDNDRIMYILDAKNVRAWQG